jgi:hypothetical protein
MVAALIEWEAILPNEGSLSGQFYFQEYTFISGCYATAIPLNPDLRGNRASEKPGAIQVGFF